MTKRTAVVFYGRFSVCVNLTNTHNNQKEKQSELHLLILFEYQSFLYCDITFVTIKHSSSILSLPHLDILLLILQHGECNYILITVVFSVLQYKYYFKLYFFYLNLHKRQHNKT